MKMTKITTAGEAEQKAIDWQKWASEQNLSWGEVAEWGDYFTELGKQFNLTEEFKENGII